MRSIGRAFYGLATVVALLCVATPAHAGMPSFNLTDIAKDGWSKLD